MTFVTVTPVTGSGLFLDPSQIPESSTGFGFGGGAGAGLRVMRKLWRGDICAGSAAKALLSINGAPLGVLWSAYIVVRDAEDAGLKRKKLTRLFAAS